MTLCNKDANVSEIPTFNFNYFYKNIIFFLILHVSEPKTNTDIEIILLYLQSRSKKNISMRNKTKRLLTIRKLIESELISSQEELLFRLKEMNVEATQSTLSRDLKFMKVAKIPHKEKGYIYVIPESIQNEQREEKVSSIITDTILSIDFSGNMAVIKTLPGYANAVTVLIDSENYFEILGTIAGDDTIFIVMREGVSRSELVEALTSVHPAIHTLYK